MMLRILAVLLLWGGACGVRAEEAGYWLKTYPRPAYFEIWHLSLKVPNLPKALGRSLSIVAKRGGRPVVATEDMASSRAARYQQLSFTLPRQAAPKAVRSLQALGKVEGLQKNPGFDPALYDDIPQKLLRLKDEAKTEAGALAHMPVIGELASELISHLEDVSRRRKEASERILLNLELQELERGGK